MKLMLLTFLLPLSIRAEVNVGEFKQYVLDFQKAYEENQSLVDLKNPNSVKSLSIAKLTVKFMDRGDKKADPNELGHCEWVRGVPTVVIDPVAWNENKKRRELVIFHEFGHCVLDREHCEGTNPEGYPNSVMAMISFDPDIYNSHKQYYLQELFWTGPHHCGKPQTEFEEQMNRMTKEILHKN